MSCNQLEMVTELYHRHVTRRPEMTPTREVDRCCAFMSCNQLEMVTELYHRHVTADLKYKTSSSISVDTSDGVDLSVDDDVDLLDTDDVHVEGHGLDVEDDVWAAAIARLGLVDDMLVRGFVQAYPNQTEPIVDEV
ncbi:hypothetical protein V6N11_013652 [Hibiscus sabdariffa]|uniref:Uncharacterized protein n=2 Tax=Hibiscus sabdariffa TaxID=183260 RepID=A0ABR2CQL8_9ROSI